LAERRSELWLAVREGGWMKTGVIAGEAERCQSMLAKISACTSLSQPSLTPSTLSKVKKLSLIGVWRVPVLDGGLLTELPEVDRGGVVGNA
jgi:hypothetical protein